MTCVWLNLVCHPYPAKWDNGSIISWPKRLVKGEENNKILLCLLYISQDYIIPNCPDMFLATSDHTGAAKSVLRHRLGVSNRSKFVTYRTINPSCDVHSVYLSKDAMFIPEAYRMSFSRLRLSSHRLRIETGRWSRIPRDRRLCPCGWIQDEERVLIHYTMTQHLRNDHRNQVVFPGILHSNSIDDFRLIQETLACFQ